MLYSVATKECLCYSYYDAQQYCCWLQKHRMVLLSAERPW